MPTVTPSVYRKFHKYNLPTAVERPTKLELDEVRIDSFGKIRVTLPETFTILEGDIATLLQGQMEVTVRQTFTGDSFIESLKKAKGAGAVNITVVLGAGSYVNR